MELKEIIERIKINYQPEQIILFGSQAEDSAREDSDIDLAVIKDTKVPFYRRMTELALLCRSPKPIDFFVFTPSEFKQLRVENRFVHEIAVKGRILYDRNQI